MIMVVVVVVVFVGVGSDVAFFGLITMGALRVHPFQVVALLYCVAFTVWRICTCSCCVVVFVTALRVHPAVTRLTVYRRH